MQDPQQQQMARHVRAFYNYYIGYPAILGKIIIVCFIAFMAMAGVMTVLSTYAPDVARSLMQPPSKGVTTK